MVIGSLHDEGYYKVQYCVMKDQWNVVTVYVDCFYLTIIFLQHDIIIIWKNLFKAIILTLLQVEVLPNVPVIKHIGMFSGDSPSYSFDSEFHRFTEQFPSFIIDGVDSWLPKWRVKPEVRSNIYFLLTWTHSG